MLGWSHNKRAYSIEHVFDDALDGAVVVFLGVVNSLAGRHG